MGGRCKRRAGWLAAACALAMTAPAQAQGEAPAAPAADLPAPALIPTSAFAGTSPFNGLPQMSPDGKRLAYSLVEDGKSWLGVMDIDSADLIQQVPLTEDQGLRWFKWAGNDRLMISLVVTVRVNAAKGRVSRLFVVDLRTGQGNYIGPRAQGLEGDDVIFTDPDGEYVLLSLQPRLFAEPEVWRFRLDGTDTKGTRIEAKSGIWGWIADNAGVVRVGIGFDNDKAKIWYRKEPGEDFRLIAKVRPNDDDEISTVARLIEGSDEGFALEPGDSGHLALRRFNYATRELGEVVYENPEWDLSQVDLDDDGRPMAVHFTDDAARVVWLDPAMARLQASFERALTASQVRILDRARDGSRLLVWAGSASDPGTLYTYTAATRKLEGFSPLRPDLASATFAPVQAISYPARDGTSIRAYLTLPPGRAPRGLPLIVMPHGGPYGVRDSLVYSDEVQLLANRGYAVLQPNYRGSGGFGDAFVELGKGQIGRGMQDDLDDAVDWAAAQGYADPQRVCLVGSSYGGYAALWGVIRNPERYRCAASFAGVTEWDKQLAYDDDFLDRQDMRDLRNRVLGEDRHFDLDSVSPARHAAEVTRPVLLVQGRQDNTVPFEQFEIMLNALRRAHAPGAQFVVLEKSGHGFASPEEEQQWYDALVEFLALNNPPGPATGLSGAGG
jgi:dipeptidyl aminopeptidase/acylaminoacyl peptidase